MTSELSEKKPEWEKIWDQIHSVEITMPTLDLPYQFKIWENGLKTMSFLVKEGSGVLPLLKIGETFDMKYYSSQSVYPYENVKTVIRQVTKNDQGWLRGHYLVGLEVLLD